MFLDKFKATKSGNKLYIDYFQGAIIVDVNSDRDAYEYLVSQASELERLRATVLKESDKFINE